MIKLNQLNLWHIDYKDFLVSHPVYGKFYRPKIWCSRCRKEGNHPVKLCHLPKYKICYICGATGHLGQHCQNQHCKRCMNFHSTPKCNLNVRELKCRICSKYGHLDDVCPNHWRKFFNTTDPQIDPDKSVTRIEKNTNKSCSMCGRRHQHYSFECERLRSRPIEISSPYDMNTTFGGGFIPIRNEQPPKLSQEYHQDHTPKQLDSTPTPTPTPTSSSSRKSSSHNSWPRYFTWEANESQTDQPPTTSSCRPPSPPVISLISPPLPPPDYYKHNQNNNNNNNSYSNNSNDNSSYSSSKKAKNRRKKQKEKARRKKIRDETVAMAVKKVNESDYIKGGSIRSGRVKKTKFKQNKHQKRQQIKYEHELLRQSAQSRQSSIKRFYGPKRNSDRKRELRR